MCETRFLRESISKLCRLYGRLHKHHAYNHQLSLANTIERKTDSFFSEFRFGLAFQVPMHSFGIVIWLVCKKRMHQLGDRRVSELSQ